jgi:hypothetical protein
VVVSEGDFIFDSREIRTARIENGGFIARFDWFWSGTFELDWMIDDGDWVCDAGDFGGSVSIDVDGWQDVGVITPDDVAPGFCGAFDWLGHDLTFRSTGWDAYGGAEVYLQLQRPDGSIAAVEDDAVVTDGAIEATLLRKLQPGATYKLLVHVDGDPNLPCAVPPDTGFVFELDEIHGPVAIDQPRDAFTPAADICAQLAASWWD